MDIKIPNIVLKELGEKSDEFFTKLYRVHWKDDDIITIEFDLLKHKLKVLSDFLSKKKTDKDCINALNQLKRYESMFNDIDNTPIKDLTKLEEAFKIKIDKSPRKWIWKKNEDGMFVPLFVNNIEYKRTKAEEGESSAYIYLNTTFIRKHDKKLKQEVKNISIYASYFREDKHTKNFSITNIAEDNDFYFDSEVIYKEYLNSIKKYDDIQNKTGKQFIAKGKGINITSNYWSYRNSYVNLVNNGIANRLVIDEIKEESVIDNHTSCKLWKQTNLFEIPIHPYIQVYDLSDHQELIVHVDLIEDYKYDKTVINKIVIKPEQRDLLDILCVSDDDLMEDIIKGKTGGIIVMCSGVAGVGKTLTAEVYSEFMERPLYKIQSSQLGITVKELEENLKNCLIRAARWQAILLIDEADTYIRERGDDIVQNCIVGVFLRMLEYYKGVLFMTTNKATSIDDAIISRCIAHLKYELPNPEELTRIFKILSEQYTLKIKDEDINGIIQLNKSKGILMSGRDVKNTLKLLKKISDKKKKQIDVEMFKSVSTFMNYSNK